MGLSTPKPAERQSVPGSTAEFRVFRTEDGELCREGDPRSAFLAYPLGAVIPVGKEEQAYYRLTHPEPDSVPSEDADDGEEEDEDPPEKAAPAPPNKMASKPPNKAAAPRR